MNKDFMIYPIIMLLFVWAFKDFIDIVQLQEDVNSLESRIEDLE